MNKGELIDAMAYGRSETIASKAQVRKEADATLSAALEAIIETVVPAFAPGKLFKEKVAPK